MEHPRRDAPRGGRVHAVHPARRRLGAHAGVDRADGPRVGEVGLGRAVARARLVVGDAVVRRLALAVGDLRGTRIFDPTSM